jgi:hypothetical protein
MDLPIELEYNKNKTGYYHVATAIENKIEAEILVVPAKMLDIHVQNNTKLPLMGCAISKKHPDHPFQNPEFKGKNIILIRDVAFKIMNEDEYQSLVEHEFGHIFHEHVTACDTPYEPDELLADAFMEHPEHMETLGKKWAIYNNKNCKECNTVMALDEETIPDHWFSYCPKCGFWIGDGYLNLLYMEKMICERVGKKMQEIPEKLRFMLDKPVLSYEENVYIEKLIVHMKKVTQNCNI